MHEHLGTSEPTSGESAIDEHLGTNEPRSGETGDLLKDFMQPKYAELARRRTVQRQNTLDDNSYNKSFARHTAAPGHIPMPFDDPEQKFVVYNLSHRFVPPRCDEPGVRICGIFADNAGALYHARRIAETDPDCTVLISPLKEWFVMAATIEMITDSNLCKKHIQEVRSLHHRNNERMHDEFQSRVKGESNTAAPRGRPVPPAAANTEKAAEHRDYHTTYMRNMELRNQTVAVVSFLSDDCLPDSGAQPLCIIWGCFDTAANADIWIRNHAGDRIQDYDLDTVDMYEWLFPLRATDNKMNKIIYRNNEKQKIFDFQNSQASTVDTFKSFCESNSQPVPVIEI